MKKSIFSLCAMLTFCASLSAGTVKKPSDGSIVHIPDANFKAALIGNHAVNTNSDEEIQVSEAQAFDEAINVASLEIQDLTGIEAFTRLSSLDCSRNRLTSLDLRSNSALVYLKIDRNDGLSSLDLSANLALKYLDCSNNYLSSLDLSVNSALEYLNCSYLDGLTSLDLTRLAPFAQNNHKNQLFLGCIYI